MGMVIIYTPAALCAAGVYHAAHTAYYASAKMADNQTMHEAALRYFAGDASALSFCGRPSSGGVISLTAPRYAKTK